MLSELERQYYEFGFGEARIKLRYTLDSFLSLEKHGLNYTDIFADKLTADKIMMFFCAGLAEDIDTDRLWKIADAMGFESLWEHCAAAVAEALPKPDPSIVQKPRSSNEKEFSFFRLRTLICDVMGKGEEFFWSSTLAELIARWQEYAVAMGYAEEPERIMEFDDEGM